MVPKMTATPGWFAVTEKRRHQLAYRLQPCPYCSGHGALIAWLRTDGHVRMICDDCEMSYDSTRAVRECKWTVTDWRTIDRPACKGDLARSHKDVAAFFEI